MEGNNVSSRPEQHSANAPATGETELLRSSLFYSDGTVRPNVALSIIHNSAICAMRARNFIAAYECMATCVSKSESFYNRPASWLRMAEACIGVWSFNLQHNARRTFRSTFVDG
jgi:hypothetical protein